MDNKVKLAAFFLATMAIFAAFWQYSYGHTFDPEQPVVMPLNDTGRSLAAELGCLYVQIKDPAGNPEYYSYNQNLTASWSIFLDRVNQTLPGNGSALFAVYSIENLDEKIVEQYWHVQRSGEHLVIEKIVKPRSIYRQRYLHIGPSLGYTSSWNVEITDDSIILRKPTWEEQKKYYIVWAALCYAMCLFLLAVAAVIAVIFGLFGYLAWKAKRAEKEPEKPDEPEK